MIGTEEVHSYLVKHGPLTKRQLNLAFENRGSTLAEMATVLHMLVADCEVVMAGISPHITYDACRPEEPDNSYGAQTRRGELSDDLGESPDY